MMAERRHATAAQIRRDIDVGITGDKIAYPDPAVAPLGTDEEAGGASMPPDLLDKERERERANAPTIRRDEHSAGASFGWPIALVFVFLAAAIVLAYVLR